MWNTIFENMPDILLDSLIDSLKVLAVVLLINILLSFFEDKISKRLDKHNKLNTLYGAMCGLIPQCGISVVASDLYLKKHITMGTLVAIFLACSDEALPIMLASGERSALMVLPLLLLKLVIGFIAGFLIDCIISKRNQKVNEHLAHCHDEDKQIHVGCCHHEIDNDQENKWHKHLIHPILHSLKLFLYVFVINLIFGIIIALITEQGLINFMQTNKYIAPLFCTVVGLIPNCASSVVISEMFIIQGISFGSALAGLCVNAGLGLVVLFKKTERLKDNLLILSILVGVSLIVGYICCLIVGF